MESTALASRLIAARLLATAACDPALVVAKLVVHHPDLFIELVGDGLLAGEPCWREQVIQLLINREKVQAIRMHMSRCGASLLDARVITDHVELFLQEVTSHTPINSTIEPNPSAVQKAGINQYTIAYYQYVARTRE